MDDITFITMHDLTADARLLYASDSITEVLGYEPQTIVGRSCFEYFHPDERPFARSVHGRGVQLDKAAVLSYCRLKTIRGDYVTCECVFTVVYSVIVASTSLYRYTTKSQDRAIAAPVIRQVFSSSMGDPRFHMLTHLSEKFRASPAGEREPRAALILNRFTKTSSILYATRSLNDVLGFELDQAVGLSFYQCIQPDCLQDAISAIERAKENDSIAYLRFNWRDPTIGGGASQDEEEEEESHDGVSNDGNSGRIGIAAGRTASAASSPGNPSQGLSVDPAIKAEAVVSCTSDGLVVVLRRARPIVPPPQHPRLRNSLFVSPWAPAPIGPQRRPALALDEPVGGPPTADFMDSIRQVAVFAWSLRSINESLLQYARPPASAREDSGDPSDGEKGAKRLKPNNDPSDRSPASEGEATAKPVAEAGTGGSGQLG